MGAVFGLPAPCFLSCRFFVGQDRAGSAARSPGSCCCRPSLAKGGRRERHAGRQRLRNECCEEEWAVFLGGFWLSKNHAEKQKLDSVSVVFPSQTPTHLYRSSRSDWLLTIPPSPRSRLPKGSGSCLCRCPSQLEGRPLTGKYTMFISRAPLVMGIDSRNLGPPERKGNEAVRKIPLKP